jgi:ribose/xylose/arabinose/galactoside ABC-type transport system permease subunit
MKKLTSRRETPIIFFTILIFLLFAALSSNFLALDNLDLILTQITTIGIVSIGMMMVILFGGIDLSVGSVLALVATAVGMMVNTGMNPLFAALLGIGIGAACGAFNGFFITKFNIPDIITTLATMFIFRGIAVGLSGGSWVTNFPKEFSYFGQGIILGLSVPVWLTIIVALLFAYVLHQTRFGRRIYAIGGNPQAAKLSGMSYMKTKFLVYVYSGIISSIAAITFAAKVGSVQASTAGNSLAFDVIAAVLIGGASIFGGIGTVLGTMFGVLLLGIIKNGLILSQASVYWIDATTGFLIVLAIILNTVQRSRELKAREGELV